MITLGDWTYTIEYGNVLDDILTPVQPKGLPIMLIKKHEGVYAVENKCAHMACPLVAGSLDGYTLKCPCHDWKFDIRTGVFQDAQELKITTYKTKLEDGKIFLRI